MKLKLKICFNAYIDNRSLCKTNKLKELFWKLDKYTWGCKRKNVYSFF